MEWTLSKSQHTKLTLEKKILPPLLPGFKLQTFRSRVWCSYQLALCMLPIYTCCLHIPCPVAVYTPHLPILCPVYTPHLGISYPVSTPLHSTPSYPYLVYTSCLFPAMSTLSTYPLPCTYSQPTYPLPCLHSNLSPALSTLQSSTLSALPNHLTLAPSTFPTYPLPHLHSKPTYPLPCLHLSLIHI